MQKILFSARLIAIVMVAHVLILFRFVNVQAQMASAEHPDSNRAGARGSTFATPIRDLEGMCLDEVVDGKNLKVYYSRKEIINGAALASQGYVTGITLFSTDPGMAAWLDNQRLIRQDPLAYSAGQDPEREMAVENGAFPGRHRYVLFPSIEGDAISTGNQFCIAVQEGNEWRDITIHQNGYQPILCAGQPATDTRGAVQFRYAGGNLDSYLTQVHDFTQRLQAVADGISRVEHAFGVELVDFVNLLSFKGPDNALTLHGQPQLWLYTDTFDSRPLNELRGMAQHEALHLLVDRMGYARLNVLKELFADFLGYGPFSLERFSLLTTGAVPEPAIRGQKVETRPFLSFINEKNFIPGLSGGHAADSLDEFATSFLHSLLHVDLLGNNLRQTDLLMMDGSRTNLTAQIRRSILEDYVRTLSGFIKASAERRAPSSTAMRTFFESCLASTAPIQVASAEAIP